MNLMIPQIPNIYYFWLGALIFAWFIVWLESKKDGFNTFLVFDQFLVGYGFAIALYAYTPLGVFSLFAGLGFLIFISYYLKWSLYRVLDIFSLSLAAVCISLGIGYFLENQIKLFLIFAFFNTLFLVLGYIYRNRFIKSGYTFALYFLFVCIFGLFHDRSLPNLIFYASTITLVLVVCYLRFRRNMSNSLSSELLKFLKDKLVNKEKRLTADQKLLIEEESLIKEGAAADNSEEVDEAILEDVRKQELDMRTKSVGGMLILVRKALALIKIGKYGVCEVCGKSIDNARLKAFPEATKCIDHAQK